MELRQAYQLCPQALFLPARERVYEEAFQGVLAVLDHFSPVVEVVSLGLAFMDLTGAARLSGEIDLARLIARKVEEEAGFRPQIGLGGSRFVAEMAARRASPKSSLAWSHAAADELGGRGQPSSSGSVSTFSPPSRRRTTFS